MAATLVSERALARTYDGGAYSDPWETVEEYRDVMQYASKHPNRGSQAVATATNTPRSRLRTWVDDDGAPDAVRGIRTARKYGWIEMRFEDSVFESLNALVANVFFGGSIGAKHYQPSFALNASGTNPSVIDALEHSGVEYTIVDRNRARADEARPTTDGTVLGRVLAVLGAPVGPKAEQRLNQRAVLLRPWFKSLRTDGNNTHEAASVPPRYLFAPLPRSVSSRESPS